MAERKIYQSQNAYRTQHRARESEMHICEAVRWSVIAFCTESSKEEDNMQKLKRAHSAIQSLTTAYKKQSRPAIYQTAKVKRPISGALFLLLFS